MPNIRGGKGYKKKKTNRDRTRPTKAIESVNVEEGEGYYATIIKRLGGKPAQFEVTLSNGTTGTILSRGRMHKKQWINPGNIVLVNNDGEIVKIVKDKDNDAVDAKMMMDKVGNNKSVFCTFFDNDSSDDENNDNNDMGKIQDPLEFLKQKIESNKNNNKKRKKEEEDEDKEIDEEDEEDEDNEEDEDEEVDECEDEEDEDEDDEEDEENEENEENEADGKNSLNYFNKKSSQNKDKRIKKNFDRSKNNHGDFSIDDI
jgi:hypothetical protein